MMRTMMLGLGGLVLLLSACGGSGSTPSAGTAPQTTNRDVPYELGFYLRGEGISQATLPKVSGGGLTQGKTQSYEITLKPGQYLFSCPLNPTPDYPIIVES